MASEKPAPQFTREEIIKSADKNLELDRLVFFSDAVVAIAYSWLSYFMAENGVVLVPND